MNTVAVVDYGMGNLRSVAKAIEHVAPERKVVRDRRSRRVFAGADRVVFPGQGAMPDCMRELDAARLARGGRATRPARSPFSASASACRCCSSTARRATSPVWGSSPARCARFPADGHASMPDGARLKVPHMGWNEVHQARAHPLWQGIADGARFYFVHSYYVEPDDARG